MTLKQATTIDKNAAEMIFRHIPNSATKEQLIKWAHEFWNVPIKILYVRVGKKTSWVIYSSSINN